MRHLFEAGCDPNSPDSDGWTPFLLSLTKNQHVEIVESFLYANGFAQDRVVIDRSTTKEVIQDFAQFLPLPKNLKPNAQPRQVSVLERLLHSSTLGYRPIIMKALEDDKQLARSKAASQCLLYMSYSNCSVCITTLCENGADLQCRDRFGRSAFDVASSTLIRDTLMRHDDSLQDPPRTVDSSCFMVEGFSDNVEEWSCDVCEEMMDAEKRLWYRKSYFS